MFSWGRSVQVDCDRWWFGEGSGFLKIAPILRRNVFCSFLLTFSWGGIKSLSNIFQVGWGFYYYVKAIDCFPQFTFTILIKIHFFSHLQIGEWLDLIFCDLEIFIFSFIVRVFYWGCQWGCLTVEGNKLYWARNYDFLRMLFIHY